MAPRHRTHRALLTSVHSFATCRSPSAARCSALSVTLAGSRAWRARPSNPRQRRRGLAFVRMAAARAVKPSITRMTAACSSGPSCSVASKATDNAPAGRAAGFVEKQFVCRDRERNGESPEHSEARLRRPRLVAPELRHVDPRRVRQLLLGQAPKRPDGRQTLCEIHNGTLARTLEESERGCGIRESLAY